MSSIEEEIECPICTNKVSTLLSPCITKKNNPELKTNCTHYLCKTCWIKISYNQDISCPYCRENVEDWLEKYLNIPIFRNLEVRTYDEKRTYISHFTEPDSIIKHLIIEDAETKTKEIFFFAPNILGIEEETEGGNIHKSIHLESNEIRWALLEDKKYREICIHHYMINERLSNFSTEKIKLITKLRSSIEGNIFDCFCGVKLRKQNLDKHILSYRHTQFMYFFIDKNFDKYAKMFEGYNIG